MTPLYSYGMVPPMLKNLLHGAALILAAALCFASLEIGLLARNLSRTVSSSSSQLSLVLQHLDRVAGHADQGIAQLDVATAAEMATLARTNTEVLKASANLHDLLIHTDLSLNGTKEHPGLLPQLAITVDSTHTLLSHTTIDIDSISDSLKPGVDNFVLASSQARELLSSPDIPSTLHNVNLTSSQVLGIATDTHTETGLIVGKTREAFAPKNKFLSVLQMVGGGTVTAAELFYYLTH